MNAEADQALEEIRNKRKQELQSQQQQPTKQDVQEQSHLILSQILSKGAKDRLERIRMVKEDKAQFVESQLIKMAQSGQIRGQVSEEQLISFLKPAEQKRKIVISRRRESSDDEDIVF